MLSSRLCLLLCFAVSSTVQTTYDLAADFSGTSNPSLNGVWSYLDGSTLPTTVTLLTDEVMGDGFVGFSGPAGAGPDILKNLGSTTSFGIGVHYMSLEADSGTPDARFTAPAGGVTHYNIYVQIGGSTLPDTMGTGNNFAANAQLLINGVPITPTSTTVTGSSKIRIWDLNAVALAPGGTVDVMVLNPGGPNSGNTQTVFTVQCDVPTAAPTGAPTGSPTGFPTASPTGAPTGSPTGAPTSSPTGYPTRSPTKSPTPSPTRKVMILSPPTFAFGTRANPNGKLNQNPPPCDDDDESGCT